MANLKTFTNPDEKVSEHFKVSELWDKTVKKLVVDMDLIARMEQLRSELGVPINVTSCYRSPEHNAKVPGSSKGSRHMVSDAMDWNCGGKLNGLYVLDKVNKLFKGKRFGIYQSAIKGRCFIHSDISNVNSSVWVSHLVNGVNKYTYYSNYSMLYSALVNDPKLDWKNLAI